MTKFAFIVDAHYGFENRGGRKVALHDQKAIDCALAYVSDFKPDVLILGGDVLDCAVVSHHNKGKPGRVEGMRLYKDAEGCRQNLIEPLRACGAKTNVMILGNHEAWLDDLEDDQPGLIGLVSAAQLLDLEGFTVLPQGGHYNLGKLTFIHGDQISGGEHAAKAAVISHERNVRFGHQHTFAAYTKTSAINIELGRTGISCPCLCTKDPKYGEGKANRWVQGLLTGYVHADGGFNDYVSIITNGRMVSPSGKVYRG